MAQAPPQPAYVLRGHGSQIHATAFVRRNTRLLTGDAEGWIVMWSSATKRPVAVWKAHDASILGISAWGSEKLITHGKDNNLIVWKLSEEDESSMSIILPVDTSPSPRKQPWLLHILQVNTMNFCSFAQTEVSPASAKSDSTPELLIAVPNTLSSETVDIFHLPTAHRIHTIPNPTSPPLKGGMIMALSIFQHPTTAHLTVLAGYESGHIVVFQLYPSSSSNTEKESTWRVLYRTQAHTQPILSLDVSPTKDFYFTSSADALLVKHPIPIEVEEVVRSNNDDAPMKVLKSGHAGQQSLRVRNDGKVFTTAGWDGRVRVYGVKAMKELAVLKWHKEGVFCVGFADVEVMREEYKDDEYGGGHEVVKRTTVKEERVRRARETHWIAVGGKDGKVSLWDIY